MPEHDTEQNSKMDFLNENFNNRYWIQVIYHCIKNDDFLKKVVQIIPLDTFRSREKRFIMKMLYDFYSEFKCSPNENFYDLFKEQEEYMTEDLYDKCMSLIKNLKNITGSNSEYILSKLSDALRHFYLEEASVEFASLIKRKKYDEAKAVILAAMKKTEIDEQQEYYDYFTDKSYIEKRLSETKYKMKTRIKHLDEIIGGLNPTWLTTILAATKVGKCAHKDTKILLSDGSTKTIEQIYKDKDKNVICLNEKNRKLTNGYVVDYFDNGIKECFEVETRTGRKVKITKNHPLLTLDGWEPLKNISVGDFIAVPKLPIILNDNVNTDIFWDVIVSIKSIGKHQTYDISVENHHNFIANNIIIHNSWMLLELAVAALLQGLNVLFVSLEMNKDMVDGRLDQIIGFMSSQDTDEPQEVLKFKKDQWVKTNESVKTIYDIGSVEKNRKRIRKIGGGNLKIMAFNRGRMNYHDINRVLDEAELNDGFIADVLVVDYLGLMRETASGQSKKERIGENCLGLKETCGKRNMIGLTAMQGNRKAMTAAVFHSHMVSEDIDVIFNSDLIMAMCQTKAEEKQNKYRLYGANYRHGRQHWTVDLVRDLTIGQIALDSKPHEEKEVNEEEDANLNY